MSPLTAHRIKVRSSPKDKIAIAAAVEQVSIIKCSDQILLRAARAFLAENITRLGVALAFYTTVAAAPLLVLTIAVAGPVFATGKVATSAKRIPGMPSLENQAYSRASPRRGHDAACEFAS